MASLSKSCEPLSDKQPCPRTSRSKYGTLCLLTFIHFQLQRSDTTTTMEPINIRGNAFFKGNERFIIRGAFYDAVWNDYNPSTLHHFARRPRPTTIKALWDKTLQYDPLAEYNYDFIRTAIIPELLEGSINVLFMRKSTHSLRYNARLTSKKAHVQGENDHSKILRLLAEHDIYVIVVCKIRAGKCKHLIHMAL